jgi:plastocyanin
MIARLSLLAATAFVGVVAIAHAQQQHPTTAAFAVLDNRYALDGTGGAQATVALGATVSFAYAEGDEVHNVNITRSGPTCVQAGGAGHTNTGRVLPNPSEGPGWTVRCTFNSPGVYRFICDDHSEMEGKLTVANADGTLPSEGGTPTPTPTPTATPGPGASPQPGAGNPSGGGGGTTASDPKWTIAGSQRGTAVRAAFTGGSAATRVTIEALARRADLKATGKAKLVRVGRVTRTVAAGAEAGVSVSLDAKGKAALKRLGKLKLTLRVIVAGKTATKTVTLRRPAKAAIAQSLVSVNVLDNSFGPRTATVKRGGSVTWRWKGKRNHDVAGKGFRSKIMRAGIFKKTFSSRGTFSYVCTLHRGMDGTIRVK